MGKFAKLNSFYNHIWRHHKKEYGDTGESNDPRKENMEEHPSDKDLMENPVFKKWKVTPMWILTIKKLKFAVPNR